MAINIERIRSNTLLVNNKKVYLRDKKLTRYSANKLSEEEIKCVYWFITNPLHIQSSVIESNDK